MSCLEYELTVLQTLNVPGQKKKKKNVVLVPQGQHVDQQPWKFPEVINQPGGFDLIDIFPGLESLPGCLLGACPNFLASFLKLKRSA